MIAGVAGGVAEMLDADPSIIRIVWALLIFLTGGIALLVYIVMAIVVPERPEGMPIATVAPMGTTTPTEPLTEGSWRAPDGSAVPMAAAAPSGPRPRSDPADRTRAGLIAGLLLILLGGFFLIRQFIPSIDLSLWWPAAAIIAGVLLIVLALLPPRRSS
jgi:phage shock protein PspC (stress-responsive transcriptional regulator)